MLIRRIVPILLSFSATALAQDLGVAGPGAYDVRSGQSIALTQPAVTMQADFYVPRAAGPRPVVLLAHGFGSEKVVWGALGKHLASWGFVAIAPSFPGPFAPDHVKNGQIIRAVLDTWAPAQNALSGSVLFGKLDVAKVASVGHSAGGLATLLAMAARPGTVGVMLDWVDSGSGSSALGAVAATSVDDPAAFFFAEPSSCNSSGNGASPSASVLGPTMRLRVNAANHCDPIDSAAFACSLTCGAPESGRQKLFRAYTTAWLLRFLEDDRTTDPWLGGATYAADLSAGRIENAAVANLPVDAPDAGTPVDAGVIEPADAGGAPVDAGTAPIDAGSESSDDAGAVTPDDAGSPTPEDAGTTTTADAGSAADAGSTSGQPDDGNATGADGGCGCGGSAGGLALLGLVWRRRRS